MTDETLSDLGWSHTFAAQIDANETVYRITEVHRDIVVACGVDGEVSLTAPMGTGQVTVGDWVVAQNHAIARVLERQTTLARRASGEEAALQLIAANVSTLAIVTSCNADFNEARLERYLVIAAEAGCLPLILLTKADECDDPEAFRRRADRLSPLASAMTLNATDPEDVARLEPWTKTGETLALLGSSGVGKTTLRNALTGDKAATQGMRVDDAKGRHTTTARTMLRMENGGWLIDTPGMRALRLADAADGISAVFQDLEELALGCKFSDCAHDTEPGCAIRSAIENDDLDPVRLRRWQKLLAEEARNTESVAQARARDKSFGKMVKSVMAQKRGKRGK